MKKFILFLFLLCTLPTIAQVYICGELYPTVTQGHHLSFLGIPFSADLKTFKLRLAKKNIQFVEKQYNRPRMFFKGDVFGIKTWKIRLNYTENSQVYSVLLSKDFDSENALINAKKIIFNSLIYIYGNVDQATSRITLRQDDFTQPYYEEVYRVISKDNCFILGTVLIGGYFSNHDNKKCYTLYIEFTDSNNYVKENGDDFLDFYDISKFTKPYFDSGSLQVFNNQLELRLRTSPHDIVGDVICLTKNENRYISGFLADKHYTELEKEKIFRLYFKNIKYLLSQIGKKYTLELDHCLDNCLDGYDYEIEDKKNTSSEKPNENYGLANFLFDGFMGKDLIKIYKDTGMYDGLINSLKRGSHYNGTQNNSTNWDGLNDAQKSVIHEHDNAR